MAITNIKQAVTCCLMIGLSDVTAFSRSGIRYTTPITRNSEQLRTAKSMTNKPDVEPAMEMLNMSELKDKFQKAMSSASLSLMLLLFLPSITPETTTTPIMDTSISIPIPTLSLQPPRASAADYASFTTEQKAIAEAWREVDRVYIDRTFGGQDWFALRQKTLYQQKYKGMAEAQNGIEVMISSLGDKYTRYLSPQKYQSMVNSATGTFAGVGIELKLNPVTGAVFANDVEANSPASDGGILPKDVFVMVDGVQVVPGTTTPDDVAGRLRGEEGSKLNVLMKRGSGEDAKTLDLILTRKKIQTTSVKTYLSEMEGVGKVGVIRIKSFSSNTASLVKENYNALKAKGAVAFVLDLRNNPGGLLPGGVDTAGLFLEQDKPVVFVVDKKGVVDAQCTYTKGIDVESPLVILVNDQTASASEVLTAALRENKRATIVGETPTTFGKGVVQTIRVLGDNGENGGIAVTMARYETPDRNNINKKGVEVDITLKDGLCDEEDCVKCLPVTAFVKPLEIK